LFLLKKLVSRLLFPVPLSLELALVGLILLWFTRRQKAGKILVTLAVALWLALSMGTVSGPLIAQLERHYPPLDLDALPVPAEEIAYVVAFADCKQAVDGCAPSAQVGLIDQVRMLEAIRIYRQLPQSKLILSGGLQCDPSAPAEALTTYRLAVSLGVPPKDILLEQRSLDTDDQVRYLSEMVGQAPFVLVTSAVHMPRAVAMFRKAGLRPIPAPAEYNSDICGVPEPFRPWSLYPNAVDLLKAERAIYEYLGLLWARIRGII